MSILEVRQLNVWFDLPDGRSLHAVRGLDLTLEAGERLGLVGESGCGKSSVVLAAMGLLPPNAAVAGQVLVDGQDLLARGEEAFRAVRWKDLAVVFQGTMNAFNPVRPIGAQIAEPMQVHGTATGPAARQRTEQLLELVGLPAQTASHYPHQLSGGMRQRAAIAMALACRPRVLLADEPTTALDVMVQAQVLEALDRLAGDGLSVLLVSHDLALVAQVCKRVAVMYAGEVVELAAVERLAESPAHPYTRLLFDAVPDLDGHGDLVAIPGAPPRPDEIVPGCPFHLRCPHAFDRCVSERPALQVVGAGQQAACHLHDAAGCGLQEKAVEAKR